MPLVDYRCESCGAVREVFAASPVPDTAACEACGGEARRKFGLGGLLGVRPAKAAKARLDRERATAAPAPAGHSHDHHSHDHGHDHGHSHDHHSHDHSAPKPTTTKEESL